MVCAHLTPLSQRADRKRHAHAFSFALRECGKLAKLITTRRHRKGSNMAEGIRDVMTANPSSLGSSSNAIEAARLMRDEDAGIIPIVEGDKLIGTVTDRDIAIRVVAEGKDPETTTVGEIASRELVTIDPQQDLDEALRLMARHQVRRLPVVEEDGKLVGIVAQKDIAQHATDEQTGDVVEDISK